MILINNKISEGGNEIFTLTCSIIGLFCMIVAVLGIKFKWFKHRLNFESFTTERNNRNGEPIPIQGVFRSRTDADNYIDVQRPKSLPPIRIRKSSSRTQIHLPVRNAKSFVPQTTDDKETPPLPPTRPPPNLDDEKLSEIQILDVRNPNFSPRSEKLSTSNSSNFSSKSKTFEIQPKPRQRTRIQSESNDENNKDLKINDLKKDDLKILDAIPDQKKHFIKLRNENNIDPDLFSHMSEHRSTEYVYSNDNNLPGPVPQARRQFIKLKDDESDSDSDLHTRIAERRPTGYVRGISEDWEIIEPPSVTPEHRRQFIQLKDESENETEGTIYTTERRPTGYVRGISEDEEFIHSPPTPEHRRQFIKLKDESENETEGNIYTTERRPTGYVRGISEDEEFIHSPPTPEHRRQFIKLKDESEKEAEGTIYTTERRPTGHVRPKSANIELIESIESSRQFIKLKNEHDHDENSFIAQRRSTGYLYVEENAEVHNIKSEQKVFLKLESLSDEEDDNQNIFEKVKSKPKFDDKIEENDYDVWSAVANRRNLNQEIANYNTNNMKLTTGPTEFRNPLADTSKTMRDMRKRNEASKKSERVSDDDTEA